MSPKKLTDQEMNFQKQKLLERGKDMLFSYGVKKTSVDDITKAAGMAKGTFYKYFESKEEFILELLRQLHITWFHQAELYFSEHSFEPLKERVRSFIRKCFYSQDFLSFFKYHDEFEEILQSIQASLNPGFKELIDMEYTAYERLLNMFHFDIQRVKPGVIHNYLHAMYFGIANVKIMENDCLDETFEALLNGLIEYIFGGVS